MLPAANRRNRQSYGTKAIPGRRIPQNNGATAHVPMGQIVSSSGAARYKNTLKTVSPLLHLSDWRAAGHTALTARKPAEYTLSPERLILAHEMAGLCWPLDFMDYLEISPEEFAQGMDIFECFYGPSYTNGQYIITWKPFGIHRSARK